MKTIRLDSQEGCRCTLFPDNQPHVNVACQEGEDVTVIAPLRSSLDLIQLMELSNALDGVFGKKRVLKIPYLMGARSDRRMLAGDSADLKVVADMVNYCDFQRVVLFDVHSDTALQLINNSTNVTNEALVKAYTSLDSVLICPDAGASKKVGKYLEWNQDIKDVVFCTKVRDLANMGILKLQVLNASLTAGRDCVIIDDLCDGGATFVAIASQLPNPARLTLVVSHGVFSKGFHELEKWFDEIITTDSYSLNNESAITTVLSTEGIM